MDPIASTLITALTTLLGTFGSSVITTVLPVMWSILAVTAVVGFGWLLIRRFTGR